MRNVFDLLSFAQIYTQKRHSATAAKKSHINDKMQLISKLLGI